MENTGIELGGVLNSGFNWKELILYSGAAIAITAGIGAITLNAKKHSELLEMKRASDLGGLSSMMQQPMGRARQAGPPSSGKRGKPQMSASDMQQLLQHCINTAMNFQQQGKHVDASKMFLTAAELAQEQGAAQYVVQFQTTALQELATAGRYDMAYDLLVGLPPGEVPEAIFAHELQLSRFLCNCIDHRIHEHLDVAEQIAKQLPESDLQVASVNKVRGEFYTRQGNYNKAEEYLRSAISAHVASHKQKGSQMLSKEALACFFELQKMYIGQGKPTKAVEINDDEISTLTTMNYDDITFFWHLTHLAYIFIEHDYDNFAERMWKRVIEMYQSGYEEIEGKAKGKRTKFDERVLSIVTNSKNEMSVMFFNQGKTGLYNEISSALAKKEYQLHTTSKYFDSLSFNLLVSTDPDTGYLTIQFIFELKVRNHNIMTGVRNFRFKVKHGDQLLDCTEHDYDPMENVVVMLSSSMNQLEKGSHTMLVEVVSDSHFSDEDEVYSHIQNFHTKQKIAPNSTVEDLQRQS